jgi:GT2 family glycosyltransferase
MSKVAAIVVNWNGGALALESVQSLARQRPAPEIWLVDNASHDGSAAAIVRACPGVRLIQTGANLGFAAGNNLALREVLGRHHILLFNNDAILPDPDSLAEAVYLMETTPSVHGVCGRFEYPDGRFQNYYNAELTPLRMAIAFGFARHWKVLMKGRTMRRFYLLDADFSRPMTLHHPAFACVLLRRASAACVGLMDERFPIYFNDSDYCARWRKQGWTWHYRPDWRVVHHQGQSTKRLNDRAQAELASSAVLYCRKHFSGPVGWLAQLAVFSEVCWRRSRHGEMRQVALGEIWRGATFFNRQPLG